MAFEIKDFLGLIKYLVVPTYCIKISFFHVISEGSICQSGGLLDILYNNILKFKVVLVLATETPVSMIGNEL